MLRTVCRWTCVSADRRLLCNMLTFTSCTRGSDEYFGPFGGVKKAKTKLASATTLKRRGSQPLIAPQLSALPAEIDEAPASVDGNRPSAEELISTAKPAMPATGAVSSVPITAEALRMLDGENPPTMGPTSIPLQSGNTKPTTEEKSATHTGPAVGSHLAKDGSHAAAEMTTVSVDHSNPVADPAAGTATATTALASGARSDQLSPEKDATLSSPARSPRDLVQKSPADGSTSHPAVAEPEPSSEHGPESQNPSIPRRATRKERFLIRAKRNQSLSALSRGKSGKIMARKERSQPHVLADYESDSDTSMSSEDSQHNSHQRRRRRWNRRLHGHAADDGWSRASLGRAASDVHGDDTTYKWDDEDDEDVYGGEQDDDDGTNDESDLQELHQADLFWFSRPKLTIYALQGIMFLSALSAAVTLNLAIVKTFDDMSTLSVWLIVASLILSLVVLLVLLRKVREWALHCLTSLTSLTSLMPLTPLTLLTVPPLLPLSQLDSSYAGH